MEKITKPNVRSIYLGKNLIAKQMQAAAGAWYWNISNMESIIFIHEGECSLNMNGEDIVLKKGEGYVIPPDIKHQIRVITDFKCLYFMPAEIEFEFFN